MLIESQIEGRFTGWNGHSIFVLTNGQFWVQAQYAYRYHYAYRPRVVIETDGVNGILRVEGIEEALAVRRTQGKVSRVHGAFKGWSGDTTFKLNNGEKWQQARYHYEYKYSYNPEAILYMNGGTWMAAVDGMRAIEVRRI